MAKKRILNERYEIERTLGEGGMAKVYRGTDRVLGRTVAIKVLSDRFAGDQKFVTRFRREAQAAAGLNHSNIVSIYDTGDQGNAHYIVMEYVEGQTLGDILRAEGALPPERAVEIADAVALALVSAHEAGLVHRDIKPGNVMLTSNGEVKVMDFGIARAAADDTLTQTGIVLGTAAYLSPEQAQGRPVDARSDIYSLGCVLYETLTGRPPFTGDSPVAIAYKHVNEEPVPPSEVNTDVPPAIEGVVMRALAKDPDDRFPTAEAFREALASAAALGGAVPGAATEAISGRGGDTQVMPAAALATAAGPPPGERPPGGRRWLPGALAAAAVVALVGIGLLTLLPDGDQRGDGRQRDNPPAEEETSPPATVGVEDALAGLEEAVTEGVAAGEVSSDAGEGILEVSGAAAEKYAEGDLDKALEELGKAHEETDKALSEGQITSSLRADAIHQAIDIVATAMSAAPPSVEEESPPPQEEEGEEGDEEAVPGNSEGKGKGKAKGKD